MIKEFEYVFALPNGRYQGHYNRHLLKGNYPGDHPEFKAWLNAGKPVHDISEFDTIYPPEPTAEDFYRGSDLGEKIKDLEEIVDMLIISILEEHNV